MSVTTLDILTWNLYLGADISRLINAPQRELPERMSALWSMVQSTDYPARGSAIAAQIAALSPDLVPDVIALQEAFRWSIVSDLSGPPGPATLTVCDFGLYLMGALAAHGLTYVPGAIGPGISVTLPTAEGKRVRFEDSVMVLVRSGGPRRIAHTHPQHGTFRARMTIRVGDTPLAVRRPWAAVDLGLDGASVRVLVTHLEAFDEAVRIAQMDELVQGPGATPGPLIIPGDFNGSAPGDGVYRTMLARGFTDLWSAVSTQPGHTFGHVEDLRNPAPDLTDRLDWIMVRGGVEPGAARLMGVRPESRTPGGLWPSDHAGVWGRVGV